MHIHSDALKKEEKTHPTFLHFCGFAHYLDTIMLLLKIFVLESIGYSNIIVSSVAKISIQQI